MVIFFIERIKIMRLNNGTIEIEIDKHGAELKSAVKNGREYMWYADPEFWGRTSPVLFPFVGSLLNKTYRLNGKEYTMQQHGFARDKDFELLESTENSVTYILKSDSETLKNYPFEFTLIIKYTVEGSAVKVEWTVKNENDSVMSFSIGGHPAFNLTEGQNYFKFDTDKDLDYYLIDKNGFFDKNNKYILKNGGIVPVTEGMFDNDALIIEDHQTHEVSLCDSEKKPYVTVKFNAPLFGLWAPAKKGCPFICIEPWYGRCDRNDFDGDVSERDHIINLEANGTFKAEYEIEFI